MSIDQNKDFEVHCRDAVHRLRSALLEMYLSVRADPQRPQEVSRKFHLNKNLTWKIARVLNDDDVLEAAGVIPGKAGLEILLNAFANAGAPAERVDRIRQAATEFEAMIVEHAGDRATFDLILDSMASHHPLAKSRELAFKGNSGVWGVQAETRVTAHFLAPNPEDPSRLDLATIAGAINVRMLRRLDAWPLFHLAKFDDDAGTEGERRQMPLSRVSGEDGGSFLLHEFCSSGHPSCRRRLHGRGEIYEISGGRVGRHGEFSCYIGFRERGAVPRFKAEGNEMGLLYSTVSLPAASLVFDVFAHKDLTEAHNPKPILLGNIRLSPHFSQTDAKLPIHADITNLGRGSMVTTPRVPDYDKIVQFVAERCGWDMSDFHATRWVLEYPPMPSTASMQFPLPEDPRGR